MTRMRRMAVATALALAVGTTAACVETRHEGPTSPTQVLAVLSAGNWSSSTTAVASALDPKSCGNLEWKITSLTDTSASGTFKAVCGGGLTLEGSAEGKLNGMAADLQASGTVGGAGMACSFSLVGTAVPEGLDRVRITYSGSTCLGPVSGSEVIRK